MCHRNLSLDTIELDGNHASIGQLDWCMPFVPMDNEQKDGTTTTTPTIHIPGGTNPIFVAPEYFQGPSSGDSSSSSWDSFKVDVWVYGRRY